MKRYIAELLGTFIMVFCGTGAIIIDQQIPGSITHAGVAVTWGLVVTSLIYALGDISGAHMNPAVSIAFSLAGRFERRQLLAYLISQAGGALLASLLLKLLFPASTTLGASLPAGSEVQSFVLELLLTFFLMLVILQVADGSREHGLFAGIAVGSVVGLEAMFAGPVCGASMNPARSFAPAIVSGHVEHLWLYIFAPALGAALAVPVWQFLRSK